MSKVSTCYAQEGGDARKGLEANESRIEPDKGLVDRFAAKLNFYKGIGVLKVKPDGMFDISQM